MNDTDEKKTGRKPKLTKAMKIYRNAKKKSICGKCLHLHEFVIDEEPEPRAVCMYGKRIFEFPTECRKFKIVKDGKFTRL